MNDKPSIVIVSITPPRPQTGRLPAQEQGRIEALIHKDKNILVKYCPPGSLIELNDLTFLLDQDEAYPALIRFIEWCNTDKLQITICELGERPVLIAPEHQDALKFLEQKGHSVRLLRFEEQEE
jgi:hypothetical protein